MRRRAPAQNAAHKAFTPSRRRLRGLLVVPWTSLSLSAAMARRRSPHGRVIAPTPSRRNRISAARKAGAPLNCIKKHSKFDLDQPGDRVFHRYYFLSPIRAAFRRRGWENHAATHLPTDPFHRSLRRGGIQREKIFYCQFILRIRSLQGRFGSGHRLGQAEIQRRGILRVMPCGPTHGMVQRRAQQHRHRKDREMRGLSRCRRRARRWRQVPSLGDRRGTP